MNPNFGPARETHDVPPSSAGGPVPDEADDGSEEDPALEVESVVESDSEAACTQWGCRSSYII